MKFLSARLKIFLLVALLFFIARPSQAQTFTDVPAAGSPGTVADVSGTTFGTGTTTGTGTTGDSSALGAEGGSAALSTEVDTSAFSSIERGDTIGTATVSGFGLAAENGGANTGLGGIGGGGLGAFGGLGGLGGLSNLFGGGLGGAQASKPIIRTRIRSAIKVAPMPPTMVQQQASMRLGQITGEREFRGLNVQMIGRTAVLTGTVAEESDRRMSELLLRLEPGISKVDNRVVVLSPEASRSPSDR